MNVVASTVLPIDPGVVDLMLPDEVHDQVLVPERPKTWEFINDEVRTHKGEPFSFIDYPWTKGICEAWDNSEVRIIALQFAARLGKTSLAQAIMVSSIAHDPNTWMYGNATENLVKRTIRDKYYPMFEMCPTTMDWVPPKRKRLQLEVVLSTCRGYSGWSGSPTTLADLDPKFLHAGEVDKWTTQRSTEADPLPLFLQRGKEIPDRKVLLESTPSVTHASRIENYLLSGWNCRFNVRCPRCKKFAPLDWGSGPDKQGKYKEGGVIFDKRDGKLHAQTAKATARYLCGHCWKEWGDDEKKEAIQQGIWVPEGQYLTKNGRLRGKMQNPGEIASFQLSRLYAPTFTFGDVAYDFVVAETTSEEQMKDWRNSVMGWTWSPLIAMKPWEEVAKTLCESDEPYDFQTVPIGGCYLTAAIDVQDDTWVYKVIAWGHEARGWVVDWGVLYSWDEVSDKITTEYPHADGGTINIRMTLVDAKDGNRKDEVIDFCRRNTKDKGPFVWPYMGSSANLQSGRAYRHTPIDDANQKITGKQAMRKKHTLFGWITGNTSFFQQWMNNCLYRRTPPNRMSLAYPKTAVTDQDLFQQLINESPSVSLDTTGHGKISWVVVRKDIPVDLRDCARMCATGIEVYLRGNWARVPKKRRKPKTPRTKPSQVASEQTNPTKAPTTGRPSKRRRMIKPMSSRRVGKGRK